MISFQDEMIQVLKEEFPNGARVELEYTNTGLSVGDKGTVLYVDAEGNINVGLDKGISTVLKYGVDKCRLVD